MACIGRKVLSFFGVLMLCAHFNAGAENATVSNCAAFGTTTWKEYRQDKTLQIQYLLFNRQGMSCGKVMSPEAVKNISSSYYTASLPTKIIIHGFRALGSKPSWIQNLVQALLTATDANVLVVDWIHAASFAYNRVVNNYQEVALEISHLIKELINIGSKKESIHLIGVSVGAHVAGYVGTLFGGRLGRITGLDAAGPMFKHARTFNRLDHTDALFVEAIHTDSDNFGISIPVGHVNFFLNGGNDQPGCTRSSFSTMYDYLICDHMRAVYVYISALNGSCPLMGFPCDNYERFVSGSCLDCKVPFNGSCPQIGLPENNWIKVTPPENENLFLMTTAAAPFCTHHFLLELEITPLKKSTEVLVTLRSERNSDTQDKIKLQSNVPSLKKVTSHPAALCNIDSIELKTSSRFFPRKEITIHKICITQLPYGSGKEEPLCVEDIVLRRNAPWSHDFVHLCTTSNMEI
ncbi:phospholipase A1 member A isoform X2 [Amia ocellicauda]|uniref:phospholipase A1 member A isoform X2 n=1 Tax=Amia ocellicauda TaxID=2972642 RepID=UPI003463E218